MNILGISTPWEVLSHSLRTGQPYRIVVKLHGCTYRGYVATIKALDGTVPFESILEKQTIEWFVREPRIVQIVAQPGPFTLEDGSQYTADFLLCTCDGRALLIEVKWEAELQCPVVLTKLMKAKALFDSQGIEFHVLTESTIRNPILRDNLRKLKVVAHLEVPPLLLGSLYGTFRDTPSRTFAELASHINSPRHVKAAIAQGLLRINLLQPLNEDTLVWKGVQQ